MRSRRQQKHLLRARVRIAAQYFAKVINDLFNINYQYRVPYNFEEQFFSQYSLMEDSKELEESLFYETHQVILHVMLMKENPHVHPTYNIIRWISNIKLRAQYSFC